MRRKIGVFLLLFILNVSVRVFATENINMKASINGEVKKGKQIEILIDFDQVKSVYAGALYYKYDPKVLKVTEIVPGELISKKDINKFEATKNIDSEKGMVSYAFTCMGDINGFSGKGNFIKLKAEVLEEKDFKITSSFKNKTPNDEYTMKLQVCDSNIVELPYSFTGVHYTLKSGQESVVSPTENSTRANDSNEVSQSRTDNSNNTNIDHIEKSGDSSSGNSNSNNSSNKTITANDDNSNKNEGNSNESIRSVNNDKSDTGSDTYRQGISQSKSQQISRVLVYIFGVVGVLTIGGLVIYKFRK